MPNLSEMQDLKRSQLSAAKMAGSLTASPSGGKLLCEAVAKTAESVRSYCKTFAKGSGTKPTAYLWLRELPPEVAALIVGRYVIDKIGGPGSAPYTRCAVALGGHLLEECFLRQKASKDKALAGRLKKLSKRRRMGAAKKRQVAKRTAAWESTFSERADRLQVGQQALQLFVEATGIVQIHEVYATTKGGKSHKTSYVVKMNPEVLEWCAKYDETVPIMQPLFMPSSSPPNPWHGAVGGGYGEGSYGGQRLVIRGSKRQAEAVDDAPDAIHLRATNAVQDTPWSVNADVLQVFRHLWNSGAVNTAAGLPGREDEKPEECHAEVGSEERRAWLRRVADIAEQNDSRRGHLVAAVKTLWASERMSRETRFWYPMFADFRGRLYARTGFLTPQGTDLARGLLQFADGRPIGTSEGADWLRIHLANCFGVDKVSFVDRIAWVTLNESEILSVGANPLESLWWLEADAPWSFLAACIDYWKFKQDGYAHVSRIPVAMDGSNNGLQLYALLTRNRDLAAKTNVLPGDAPADIYRAVAKRATGRLQSVADGATEVAAGCAWVLREIYPDGLPRSLVKRPVMTLPYGVTRFSARNYVLQDLKAECARLHKQLPVGLDHYKVLTAVGDAVWDSIGQDVAPALRCMKYISSLAEKVAQQGESLVWINPAGFPALQRYEHSDAIRVKTMLGDKIKVSRKITLQLPNGEIDTRKMGAAAPPNFVHSLDASILSHTVMNCVREGVTDFAVVHDSFGVPAGDAPILARAIRDATVTVFKADPLDSYRQAVEETIGEAVEPFQRDDEFKVSEVTKSKYFFA